MVSCPKCQFTQPKDQFCANCGIDMAAYRPVEAPLALRIAKNWIFQLCTFVVVVIVAVTVIHSKNRAQFSQSFAALEEATSHQRNFLSKKPVDQKLAKNLDADISASRPIASNSQAETLAPPTPIQPEPSVAQVAKAIDPSDVAVSSMPTKLKLIFAEVNRAGLATLAGETRSIASIGSYFASVLPEKELPTAGLNILDNASDLQMKLNQPIVVFKGSRDPQLEQNIGLTAQITPVFIDEQGAHLQIEVKRTLRGGLGAPISEETFQEQLTLKKDSKAYMSGLLPHRILNDEEARILSSNPTILKVLASSDFQNSNSEFVLFIEAK